MQVGRSLYVFTIKLSTVLYGIRVAGPSLLSAYGWCIHGVWRWIKWVNCDIDQGWKNYIIV